MLLRGINATVLDVVRVYSWQNIKIGTVVENAVSPSLENTQKKQLENANGTVIVAGAFRTENCSNITADPHVICQIIHFHILILECQKHLVRYILYRLQSPLSQSRHQPAW